MFCHFESCNPEQPINDDLARTKWACGAGNGRRRFAERPTAENTPDAISVQATSCMINDNDSVYYLKRKSGADQSRAIHAEKFGRVG